MRFGTLNVKVIVGTLDKISSTPDINKILTSATMDVIGATRSTIFVTTVALEAPNVPIEGGCK